MKPVVLAVVLTGLMSVTALAGEIPTNDATAPGNIPTNDVVMAPGNIPTSDVVAPSPSGTSSSGALANLVLTIVTLINR